MVLGDVDDIELGTEIRSVPSKRRPQDVMSSLGPSMWPMESA